MNACPPLPELVDELIEWTVKTCCEYPLSWTKSTLEIVRSHILKLDVDTEFSSRFYQKLSQIGVWDHRFDLRNYKKVDDVVMCFLQDLRDLFKVPKLQRLSQKDNTLGRNEIVGGLINFLLQLLQCEEIFGPLDSPACSEYRFSKLRDEMRFLLKILEDKLFQATKHEQVVSLLLDEFEEVANEAWCLVHSQAFCCYINEEKKDEASHDLFKKIGHLNYYITKFLESQPCIGITSEASTCGTDSLFIVESLLSDLEDLMKSDDNLHVKDQISVIHQWLILSKSLLQGMMLPQNLEIMELKVSLMQITNTAYEAEYLINSFMAGDAPLKYLSLRLTHVINKLELTVTRLQEMVKDCSFGVLKVAEHFGGVQLSQQGKNGSWSNEVIVGFEDEERKILDELIGRTDNLQIVFISGMPGLGKTTLAKKLYNHPWVRNHFYKRSWCVISQLHDRKNIWVNILIGLKGEVNKAVILNMDEESLALEVFQSLKCRQYLILMDDIWYSSVWDELRRYFPNDANGSRIMFTSRNKDVAPSGSIIHELPFLSSDQCWELLQKKVFTNRICPPQLQSLGKKIAANCAGLPLAVVVIAGVLSTVDEKESVWENVGDNLESYIFSDPNNSAMHTLELSYKLLPQHLKPCFLYLGIFPEDKEISVKKLTQYWIAEGFICKKANMRAESVAEGYLLELIDRSLVIISKRKYDGSAKTCMIHDLLRELSLKISEKDNFLKLDLDCSTWNHKFHRLCVHRESLHSLSPYLTPYGSDVRSFISTISLSPLYVLSLKSLRLLESELSHNDCSGIYTLVQLRYLATKKMPRFIDRLSKLEYLIVDDEYGDVWISSSIVKMVKLKYLRILARSTRFDEFCDISQSSNLEFLSCILLCNEDELKTFKYFPQLRRLKFIFQGRYNKAYVVDLQFLTMLESLTITYKCLYPLSGIKFPLCIRKLTLCSLHMAWEKIAIVGTLPNLEVLKLRYSAFNGSRWDTRDDEFQQLRVLKLDGFMNLTEWNVFSSEHFPRLQQIILHNCPSLLEVPSEIGEIVTLQLIEVHGDCQKSLLESVVSILEQQQDMGIEDLVANIGGAKIIFSGTYEDSDEDNS